MANKSFVSLSFSTNKLQILQLHHSKKKVGKFATIDLPNGLILNHKVQDKRALAVILKNVWKKLKIKEKSVGIVVPEFSTFIKLLTLPKLASSELDEAVAWQAHDFLPSKMETMSMDWKIVKRFGESYHILLMAMEREVLAGYVDATGLAGLFPLVVEPPSLSLVRVSGNNDSVKLIIYEYFDELILVIAEGSKVLGSSVVASNDRDEVVKTASIITEHYISNNSAFSDKTQLDKILVGGIGLDQNLIGRLQDSLQKPVHRLDLKVEGLSQEDFQKYLIPISLQFKEPTDPSDENTINLLPKSVVEKYENKRLSLRIWSLLMVTTFVVWSSFLSVMGSYVFLLQQINIYKPQVATRLSTISKTKDAREQIKKINAVAEKTVKVSAVFKSPNVIFNFIQEARPGGITILKYDMDLDVGEISLLGKAATRGDLIDFKQTLEKNDEFSHIVIPISSFEVESDLDFRMSLLYQFKSK